MEATLYRRIAGLCQLKERAMNFGGLRELSIFALNPRIEFNPVTSGMEASSCRRFRD
jgi:hypothetical protein